VIAVGLAAVALMARTSAAPAPAPGPTQARDTALARAGVAD